MKYVPVVFLICMPCAAALRLASHGSISPTDINEVWEASNMVPPIFDFTNLSKVPKSELDKQLERYATYSMSRRWAEKDTIFEKFIQDTAHKVAAWPVVSATNGDRVAVTIFQPADERSAQKFAYIVRSYMHRLGPTWALQVFYGEESERTHLSRALGDPAHVSWTPIRFGGSRRTSISKNEANWFRTSMDFWDQISEAHEHVLIFESDSLLLKGNGCVDKFLYYDYVGAPWDLAMTWGPPPFGGNGGLVLTRRSSRITVTRTDLIQEKLKVDPQHFDYHEDLLVIQAMGDLHMKFPLREDAQCFAVESYTNQTLCAPCGTHKGWWYLGEAEARRLLESADFS